VITEPTVITHAQIADELAAVTGHPVAASIYLRPSLIRHSPMLVSAWLVTHIDGAYGLIGGGEIAVPTDSVRRS
jgi:hypothetical protein